MRTPEVRFVVYMDDSGQWRWRAKARNGRTVADSGEGYATKCGASKAADRLVEIIQDGQVLVIEPRSTKTGGPSSNARKARG